MNARTTLGRIFAVTLAVATSQALAPVAYAAGAHLVDTRQVASRLNEAAQVRAARVQLVQQVLDQDETRRQAGLLGYKIDRMRAAVPHLSDAELADLSRRAENVNDVAAGYHEGGLVILGLVLLLAGLAVLVAVAEEDYYYDDCYCY